MISNISGFIDSKYGLSPCGSPLMTPTRENSEATSHVKDRRVRFNPQVLIRCIQDEQIEEKTISLVDDDDPSYVIFPRLNPRTYHAKTGYYLFRDQRRINAHPIDIYETERNRLLMRAHSVAQAKLSREKLFVTKRQMVQCNQEQETFSRDELLELLANALKKKDVHSWSTEEILSHFEQFAKKKSHSRFSESIVKISSPDNGKTFVLNYQKTSRNELDWYENRNILDWCCYKGDIDCLFSRLNKEAPGSLLVVSSERFTKDLGGYIGLVNTAEGRMKAFHFVISDGGIAIVTKFFKMTRQKKIYNSLKDYLDHIGVKKVIKAELSL